MFLVSVVILASTALLPTLLQVVLNYPVVTAGMLMTPRGFGTVISMLRVGKLSQRFDGRLLMLVGFVISAYSFWIPSGWNHRYGLAADRHRRVGQGDRHGHHLRAAVARHLRHLTDGASQRSDGALQPRAQYRRQHRHFARRENYLARATPATHQAIAGAVTPYNQALRDPHIAALWNPYRRRSRCDR